MRDSKNNLQLSGLQSLDLLVERLTSGAVSEHGGEAARNSYRLLKGKHLLSIESIAQGLVKDGTFSKASDVLEYAKESFVQTLRARGIVNPHSQLHPSEVSIVRKAYKSWIGDKRDDAMFNLVDEVNPSTNQRAVADNGEPNQYEVSAIATNNLYYLADHVDKENYDRLASIAWRYSEETCQLIHKVLKEKSDEKQSIIEEIATKRMYVRDSADEAIVVNGKFLLVNLDDVGLRRYLRKYLPELKHGDVASIKVDRSWYDGEFTNILDKASEIYARLGLPLDAKGQVPRTVLLERLLEPYVDRPDLIETVLSVEVENG